MIQTAINFLSVLILFFLCTCRSGTADRVHEPAVTVTQLHEVIESGIDVFLLDVRTAPEFQAARLDFVDLRIPFDSLLVNLDRLPKDRETVLYCLCRSGRRSSHAVKTLRDAGFQRATDISGGILTWQKAGFKIVSGPE